MTGTDWRQVHATGLGVPVDRPLGDLTAELTRMLGDPDAGTRRGTAYPVLAAWIDRGVYDDLLTGLGDGMAAGLTVGLGENGTDTVFRRGLSVSLLGECIRRDNTHPLVTSGRVLSWGDQVISWALRERDLRGWVPGKGWARALGHGAEALTALACSPHLTTLELTVLLDVVADRLAGPTDDPAASVGLDPADIDALAVTTTSVLRRDAVPLTVLEPWVARVAASAQDASYDAAEPDPGARNAQAFLRALYVTLAWAPRPPELRSDVLLALVDALRASNPGLQRR